MVIALAKKIVASYFEQGPLKGSPSECGFSSQESRLTVRLGYLDSRGYVIAQARLMH